MTAGILCDMIMVYGLVSFVYSCSGPFVIELTPGQCPGDGEEVSECIKTCIEDECCRSGQIINEQCHISYCQNINHQFIKHVPEGINTCFQGN